MTLYAISIFLSAFLLFQVQPLLAKLILPWFGGSSAVWTVTLMFFQTLLLLGYAYAHCLIRFLGEKGQALLHTGLLAAACCLLPILPSPAWRPLPGADPTGRILLLLLCTVGLPYFLLSASTPLFQAWFVRKTGSGMPYRLFALSNAGSLLALLSYPFFIEPYFSTRGQAWTWSAAFVAFAFLAATAAWTSLVPAPGSARPPAEAAAEPRPSLGQGLRWALLAAIPSALLLAVANHLSANVAPIPLLWILPLTLYLVTFILAFEWTGFYRRAVFLPLLFLGLGTLTALTYVRVVRLNLKWTLPGFLAGLFLCCLFCHGELARRRPAASHLTAFYLMVSLGGALGGCFVGLVAPRLFSSYLELPLGYVACGILGLGVLWSRAAARPAKTRWMARLAASAAALALAGVVARMEWDAHAGYRCRVRNFYGVLKVADDPPSDPFPMRVLSHGAIQHGSQFLDPARALDPTSYYGLDSGVGRAIRALQARGPVRLGIIGLGAGVLSTYGRKGDTVRIYEINPLVEKIAEEQFSFFPRNLADKSILLGDARLTLEAEPPQGYDLLAVDAFSGDAIPVHLLTREAFRDYFRHLKDGGVLAIHISNRYLDLEPVCGSEAALFHSAALVVNAEEDEENDPGSSASTWVLLTKTPALFQTSAFEEAQTHPAAVRPGFRPWTDDYSNLFQILKLRAGI